MIHLGSFEDYVKYSDNAVVLFDLDNILKSCWYKGRIPESHDETLKEYFAIGSWSPVGIPEKTIAACVVNIAKRLEKVLSTEEILDKESSLVVFSIYPDTSYLQFDIMEIVMPLVRFFKWKMIGFKYLENRQGLMVTCMTLQKTNIINYKSILARYQLLDHVIRYTVEGDKMVTDVEFKIVGLMADDKRKLARQMCKKYPDLKYGKGDRPDIELECVDFENENHKDPNAIAIHLVAGDKKFQLGWLSARVETIMGGTDVTPNSFVTGFIKSDAYRREQTEKIIQGVKLSTFGSCVKEGKTIYYGKIVLAIDIDNLRKNC